MKGDGDRRGRDRTRRHHIAGPIDRDRIGEIRTIASALDHLVPQLRPGGSIKLDHGNVIARVGVGCIACRHDIPCAIDRNRISQTGRDPLLP